jgi:enoyl-CoA hydratase/carnithine racemase
MATRQQLAEHFRAAAEDARARTKVLTGGDKCFVAGADIREFTVASPVEMYPAIQRIFESDAWEMASGANRKPENRRRMSKAGRRMKWGMGKWVL